MEKTFDRVRSVKDIAISALILAAGCICIVLPTSTPVNITGFFLIFTGTILFLILRTGYKDISTGERYCKKEWFFSQCEREMIVNAIPSTPHKIDFRNENNGNSIRLDMFYSKDTKKAYLQLFEYVPYKYEPCSRQYEHELENVRSLIA